jgi:hypothetical protein
MVEASYSIIRQLVDNAFDKYEKWIRYVCVVITLFYNVFTQNIHYV